MLLTIKVPIPPYALTNTVVCKAWEQALIPTLKFRDIRYAYIIITYLSFIKTYLIKLRIIYNK